MHIMMVAPSLNLGGAERIAATMANGFAAQGHQITLALLADENSPRHYPLAPEVRLVCLGIFHNPVGLVDRVINVFRRNAAIRTAIRQASPDVIVSLTDTTNVRVLLASRGLGIPVVLAEHSDPRHYDIGRIWRHMQRLTYPQAAALVVLTEDMARYYSHFVKPERTHIFYNPIVFPDAPPDVPRKKCIVYLGRLSPEKGVALLLDSFAGCVSPGWRLILAGDGPSMADLSAQVERLGVADSVQFLGRISEVYPLLASAAFCVLPSQFEGLPNALCEAMVMGTPCVATATSGAKAVIRHGKNGLLCPVGDAEALREAMARLMADAPLREAMGEQALAMRNNVSLEAVLAQWDALLGQIVQAQTARGPR